MNCKLEKHLALAQLGACKVQDILDAVIALCDSDDPDVRGAFMSLVLIARREAHALNRSLDDVVLAEVEA